MKNSWLSFKSSLTLLAATLFLGACGQSPIGVNNIQVEHYVQDEDHYASVALEFSMFGLKAPELSYPLVSSDGTNIGSINLSQTGDENQNELSIEANLSALIADYAGTATDMEIRNASARAMLEEALLPNGNELPMGEDLQGGSIHMGKKGLLRAYVLRGLLEVYLGVAIPIAPLNFLGKRIGTASYFWPYNYNGVRGWVGIFTDAEAGKSGIAFFNGVGLDSLGGSLDAVSLAEEKVLTVETPEFDGELLQNGTEKQFEKLNKIMSRTNKRSPLGRFFRRQ